MNTDPHNLMNPLREKFPYFIRHEKLYRMIHLQLMKKWFQYFVLFFIIGSICSIIYGSFMGHRTKRFFQWSGKMGERF